MSVTAVDAVGWGVAGVGWLARDFAIPAMRRCVAAYDPADAPGRTHADLEAFLAADDMEAVYVAAPNHAHRALVEAAAAAGKHVLCEKPMATSLADAEAMVDACADARVLYATAHNQRWHPAHRALAAHVAAGGLGEVTQARVHYACMAPPWWDDDDWHWDSERAGGGALWDLAPHGIDLLATLLGRRVADAHVTRQRRFGRADVEDGALVSLRFDDDTLAAVQVAYTCPEAFPRRRLELVGTRQMAIATDTMGQAPGGRVELVALDGTASALDFDAEGDPFALQIAGFERAVRGEEPWPWPAAADLDVMRVLDP